MQPTGDGRFLTSIFFYSHVTSADIVKLNISGCRFWTTGSTLLSKGENFFTGLSNWQTATKDKKGFFFIDRDGKYFGPILEYLRSGHWLPPKDANEKLYLAEAESYGVKLNILEAVTDETLRIIQSNKDKIT